VFVIYVVVVVFFHAPRWYL